MSFGSRRARKEVKFDFDSRAIDTYYSLKDYYAVVKDRPTVIRKLWINTRSKYGEHPVITTDKCHVRLSSYMTQEVRDMINNDDDVADINAGRAAFRIVEKTRKNTKEKYLGVEWCDPDSSDLPF